MKHSDSKNIIRTFTAEKTPAYKGSRRVLAAKGLYKTSDGHCSYRIFRDTRTNNAVRMTWKHGRGLILTIPWKMNAADAETFICEKKIWIMQCICAQNHLAEQPGMPKLQPGGTILFRGQMLPVHIDENADHSHRLLLRNNCLFIPPNSEFLSNIESVIIDWLKKQAGSVLSPIVSDISGKMTIEIRACTFRNQRTRWASWSTRGTISLNWRLIMAPPAVFEYVVIHELLHSVHPNHSASFWREVENHCHHWKSSRHWLNTHHFLMTAFRSREDA